MTRARARVRRIESKRPRPAVSVTSTGDDRTAAALDYIGFLLAELDERRRAGQG